MLLKLVFFAACTLFLGTVDSLPLDKLGSAEDSSEEIQILESLKKFVNVVEKYNLNVTIVGSQRKYASGGWTKEDVSVTLRMPVNEEHLTQATLEDDQQKKYLKELKKLAKKENVGIKTRVIKIENGKDRLVSEEDVNEQYLIDSPGYKSLTRFKNGAQGALPENDTNEILYNYVIQDPNDPVKSVQVITAQVIINDLDVSKDFPADVLLETKHILPKLWLVIDDEVLLARLLVQQLDKKFDGNHQVLIGVDNFALGEKKFAKLQVANSNVLVFIL